MNEERRKGFIESIKELIETADDGTLMAAWYILHCNDMATGSKEKAANA